jgi:uncharacterized protein YggL (DUF469 family)
MPFDHPFAQAVFADFDRLIAVAAFHTVGGVASAADVEVAIKRAARLNDADLDEVRRWLKEAGKL